jgi:type I restriction enzyme, S subunit
MNSIPLEELANVQLGKMLSPAAKTGQASFPYLRNQNIQWNRLDLGDLATMDFSPRERIKFELKVGDLLVCEGGEPGRCTIWNGELANCYFQKAIHRVRAKPGRLDTRFLSLWLWFQCKYGELAHDNARTTIAHLPLAALKKLSVPDIPIGRQQALVERLAPQLQYLDMGRKSLQAQRKELSRLASDRIRRIGEVLDEVKTGIGPDWASHPVYGATRSGLAPAKEAPGKRPQDYKPTSAGTVFYNPMRILIGSIAFVDDDDAPGITSPDYVVLKGKSDIVDSRWFYHWLRSPLGERCIQSLARGAVRERMLFNRLAEGEIVLPNYDTQLRASRALAQIKPMRTAIEKQSEELETLPQKLLAQIFVE